MKKQEMPRRLTDFMKVLNRRKLDVALVTDEHNLKALVGLDCDNGCLKCAQDGEVALYTDFRYIPMVHRCAPWLKVRDIKMFERFEKFERKPRSGKGGLTSQTSHLRIGYESSVSHARFLSMQKQARRAKFVDVLDDIHRLRAVKNQDEIALIRAAESLTCSIWERASRQFRAGMTELDMARIIKRMMVEEADGESFGTIVCIGANAAECHHVPDGTVWNGREPVLVDMGVKLNGVCADLTRNLIPKRPRPIYRQVYDLVLAANRAAMAAARPGITGRQLDKVARDVIRKGGFGKCFGHSLGHGVGYEIHEAPTASRRSDMVLKPGMLVTIEPGIYLEGNLGVRIEDLVLITDDGCEVLSGG